MALISVANVTFSFGNEVLLDGVNLTLDAGQHVGLVGRNGCGKSTLLKMVAGLAGLAPSSGQIQIARDATVGYLTQDPDLDHSRTLRQEAGAAFAHLASLHEQIEQIAHDMGTAEGDELDRLLKRYEQIEHEIQALGGYAVDHKVDATLDGLGLDQSLYNVRVSDLSGGQRGRLALAKLLLSEPDVLLLDEPTNHLDIAGRQWLEQFLAEYRGAVILISHDRWMLDRVVTTIYELELGALVEYPGNYQQYRELRQERHVAQQRAFDKQQTKIRHEQSFIDRYRAGQRSKQAQGREKRLERYIESQSLDRPVELDEVDIRLSPKRRSGDMVVSAERIALRHDQRTLFEHLSLIVRRGDRIGIIGPNGAGKSTLVRCLLGEQPTTEGSVRTGSQLDIGHYRQTHDDLRLDHTVVEYLRPRVEGEMEQNARDLAGAFLFSGIEQDKPLSVLSGGERSRAVLAGLVAGGFNLLVLDEPTNHLDIPSSERLEEALRQYGQPRKGYGANRGDEATLMLITHDRMLLDAVVDQLLVFDGKGQVQHFLGTYSEYVDAIKASHSAADAKPSAKPMAGKKDQPTAKTRQKKEKRQGKSSGGQKQAMSQTALEKAIVDLEQQLAEIDTKLADPAVYQNSEEVRKLTGQRDSLRAKLDPLEEEWAARAEAR